MEDFDLTWSVSGEAEVSHLLTAQQKRSLAINALKNETVF